MYLCAQAFSRIKQHLVRELQRQAVPVSSAESVNDGHCALLRSFSCFVGSGEHQ